MLKVQEFTCNFDFEQKKYFAKVYITSNLVKRVPLYYIDNVRHFKYGTTIILTDTKGVKLFGHTDIIDWQKIKAPFS